RKEAQEMLHRVRQGADEAGDAFRRLDQGLASRIGQNATEIIALAHQGGEAGSYQRRRGLIDDGDQAPPQQLQLHRIEPLRHAGTDISTEPSFNTSASPPGPITSVLSSSSRTAGPET